jgi:hypothetical protein
VPTIRLQLGDAGFVYCSLIQIKHLINGSRIVQRPIDEVVDHHVDLLRAV